jgi:integrase
VLHEKEGGKTAANRRVLELTDELVAALRAHRRRQDGARRAAGAAWVDHDLIFCIRYGTPPLAGHLLDRFRRLLAAVGLPAHHRLHDLRHTAVQSLRLGGVPSRRSAGPPATPARR